MPLGRQITVSPLIFHLLMFLLLSKAPSGVLTQKGGYPPLLEGVFAWIRDGLDHFYNEPKDIGTPDGQYDFIVVGAGSAGCAVAARLSEIEDWRVLLIEAGKEESFIMDIPIVVNFLQFSHANWKYRTVPSKEACLGLYDNRCNIPRGKVMGGSSVLNYMIYTRGHRKDYDKWEKLGNTGWGFDEVLPYFIKSEQVEFDGAAPGYRGFDGPQSVARIPYQSTLGRAFVNAGKAMGFSQHDMNGPRPQAFDWIQASMHNGSRMSTSRAYLHPANGRKNLHVLKRSHVTRVLIEPTTRRAYGVEYIRGGKKYTVIANKEVVLSAGAINTPQILMLSGIGPRQELERIGQPVLADLAVGKNLMDHVCLGGFEFGVKESPIPNTDFIINSADYIYDYAKYRRGPVASPGGIEAIAFIDLSAPNDPDGHPDLELMLSFGSFHSEPTLKENFGIKDEIFEMFDPSHAFSVYPMILRPKSRGKVWLKNRDPLSKPLIDMGYFSDPRDLDIITKGVNFTKMLVQQEPFKMFKPRLNAIKKPIPGCKKYRPDSNKYWKCHARYLSFTIYHQSGTCKMGPASDKTAVVDPRLKVYGFQGLRVVDASIFPEIPASHPNAVVIMIAEKAADIIKQDYGKIPS